MSDLKEIKKPILAPKVKRKVFWKKFAEKHWYAPDTPQSDPRFQVGHFSKWAAVFLGLPIIGFALAFGAISISEPKKPPRPGNHGVDMKFDASKSQIIDFRNLSNSGQFSSYVKRAPGTLVKVRLQNLVEGGGPVHAQILDAALGRNLLGGSLLGEAAGDVNLDRITINFNYARDPTNLSMAIPVNARALSTDGTLGIEAQKKEGMLARSALGGSSKLATDTGAAVDSFDIRYIFLRALGSGFLNEVGNGINVEKNRATLLTLIPNMEFFAELTDYFPGTSK